MRPSGRSTWILAASGIVLAGVPTVVAATSTTVDGALAVIYVAVGILLVWGVALALWQRPQDRRIATMLFVLAGTYAVRALAASDSDWVYTMSRALGPIAELMLVWVMLAFPSGRLRSGHDRAIVAAAAVIATVLWLPVIVLSPDILLSGPLVPCAADCPTNTLVLIDNPDVATTLLTVFRWASTLLLLATALSLLDRLLRASSLTRRTLAPVLVVSILRTLGIAGFLATRHSALSGIALLVLFWLVPLSMALGLLLGRLYTAAALQRLLAGIERRPDAAQLRAVLADVLQDPTLTISYWLPDRARWVDASGTLSESPPVPGPAQATTVAENGDGERIAALVHDEALLEQPGLLQAVTASTGLALERIRLQAELALSDARAADAHARARRELERDLHDGAQQRLIALRMKVSVLTRMLDQDVRRAAELADELGPDIDETLAEVREFGRGRGPLLVTEVGLADALAEAVLRIPVTVSLVTSNVARYPAPIENAVFFSCMEALQNVAKHAGPGATATVTLTDDGDNLTFVVEDDGRGGADLTESARGGLSNVRDRIREVGGEATLVSKPGSGTVVSGRIPRATVV